MALSNVAVMYGRKERNLKGLVHSEIKILLSITRPHVVPNQNRFLYFLIQAFKIFILETRQKL